MYNKKKNQRPLSIIHYFEDQTNSSPHKVALITEQGTISYAELNEQVTQLANYLVEHGVEAGQFVSILLERSAEFVVACLAILKVGAIYIPINAHYSERYLSNILKKSNSSLLITNKKLYKKNKTDDISILNIDSIELTATKINNLLVTNKAEAYVIYTSGSTGEPKGVLATHSAMINRFEWIWKHHPFKKNDICCLKAPVHFVDAVGEMFLPLLKGVPLVILPPKMEFDSQQFIQYLDKHKVTRLVLVPSQLQLILDIYPNLAAVIPSLNHLEISGEPLSTKLALHLKQALPNVKLLNRYGSSEYTSAIFFEINELKAKDSWVPIGKPIHYTKTYILDENLSPVKAGETGTLWMSGLGISPGYLNNAELSEQKFRPNPFFNKQTDEPCYEKIYNTGDLVCLNKDNDLEHKGRADYQVSLYGNRFELAEVESYLNKHPDIKQSVVLLSSSDSFQFLTAYIRSSNSDLQLSEIRQFLHDELPSYMIPNALIKLDSFPLLSNGKIDRKILASTGQVRQEETHLGKDEISSFVINQCNMLLPTSDFNAQHSFFELGFNSLMLMSLAISIQNRFKTPCTITDLYKNNSITKLSNFIKRKLIKDSKSVSFPAPTPGEINISQKRFWFLEKKIIGTQSPYHLPILIKISGSLSLKKLNHCLKEIIKENPALSSHFKVLDKKINLINHHLDWELQHVMAQEKDIDQLISLNLHQRFDLEKDFLIRGHIFRIKPKQYILSLVIHHIIFDGWSQQQFTRLIFQKYNALQQVNKIPFNKKHITAPSKQLINSFKQQLAAIEPLPLPYDFSPHKGVIENADSMSKANTSLIEGAGSRHYFIISHQQLALIKELTKTNKSTIYLTLLSIFSLLLGRYCQKNHLSLGTVISIRDQEEMGCAINTLPLSIDFNWQDDYLKLVKNISDQFYNLYAMSEFNIHSDTELSQLQLNAEGNLNTFFIFEKMHELPTLKLGTAQCELLAHHVQLSKSELTLHIEEYSDYLNCYFEFSTLLFKKSKIENMAAHFISLAENVFNCPQKTLYAFDILTKDEKNKLIHLWNNTHVSRQYKTLNQLLVERALIQADDVAVIDHDNQPYSYSFIHQKSDQLAAQLINLSNEINDLIGIAIDPGINMIIGLFGILKAKAAFLPLDVRHPQKRLQYMLQDSQVKIVLTEKQHQSVFSKLANKNIKAVVIENLLETKNSPLINNQNSIDDLAFVLYTSGSTGQPKGVKSTHRSIVNRLEWMWEKFPFQNDDRCSQKTALSFVDSLWEIFGPILKGIPLYIISQEQRLSIEQLTNSLVTNHISWLILTPSWLKIMLDYMQAHQLKLNKLRICVTSGETIHSHLLPHFKSCFPQARLLNLYGSTEVAADACFFEINIENSHTLSIPIGQPIDNMQAYVLDQFNQPLPMGVIGELCIAGDGLAQGYIDNQLTQKKFITETLIEKPVRLFKTGDLAFRQENGSLILAGRNDSQIKINGIRIDLTEIEYLLHKHSLIQNAVVLSVEQEQQQLIAFIQSSNKSLTKLEINKYLNAYLPKLFIPSFIYIYEQFPKTISGKINRIELMQHHHSLLEMNVEQNNNLNEIESMILELCKKTLNLSSADINQSFFDLGGNSLSAMSLTYKLNALFKTKFDIADIFNNPTIYELAKKIENQHFKTEFLPSIAKCSREEQIFLASSSQKRIWYAAKMQEEFPWSFNVPIVISIQGDLNISALEKSINQIIKENEVYTINFEFSKGKLYQKFSEKQLKVNVIQLKNKNPFNQIKKYAKRVFNLEKDLLIDVTLFQLAKSQFKLLINHHHIITDAWSLNVFLEKLSHYYRLSINNNGIDCSELGASKIDYIDYSTWQNQLLMKQSFEEQLNYWEKQLKNNPNTALRRDHLSLSANSEGCGARFKLNLSKRDTQKLHQFSHNNHVTLSMVLLTAFKLVVAKYTNKEDIVIGMPVANRHLSGLEEILGSFINTVAVRTPINADGCFSEALSAVKISYINALKNQDIPLEHLMESLNLGLPYQIGFDFISEPQQYKINLEKLFCDIDYFYLDTAQCDLTLFANEKVKGLVLLFEYKKDLYTSEYIENLALKYKALISQIIETESISAPIQWLSKKEEALIFSLGQGIKSDKKQSLSLIAAIEKKAEDTPSNIAIHQGAEVLHYGDLSKKINQLANSLKTKLDLGNKPLKIATYLPGNTDWIISLLTIWKLNACYVPLNPEQPRERLGSLIKYIQADLIITYSYKAKELGLEEERNIIFCLDEINWQSNDIDYKNKGYKKNNPYSYIIFTSGSTGFPKPVPIREHALLNLAYSQIEGFKIQPESRVLQFAPCSFDASLSEITTAFLSGASLYLIPEHLRKDALALSDYINFYGINVATLPPSFLASIPKDRHLALETLIIAGEQCDPDHFYFWAKDRLFINAYGPTEATICASYKYVTQDTLPNNIGKPLPNVDLYVLDEQQRLLPQGAEGELYIGGEQLTDGYINCPDAEAKFHSISLLDSQQRVYQTGDRVRWLINGDLEFIGRVDRQIKYHGIRIEPQEIEQKISTLPFVRENVVTLESHDQLVSFIALEANHFTKSNELELWPSLAEFYVYDEFIYNIMSNDSKRNFFYQKSLNKLAYNKIVLDIGTGKDAILARLAINAGAKKVYAIEYVEKSYLDAKNTLEKLNLADRIILIHGDSRKVNLPEQVDLIVSEIVGAIGGSEGAAVILNDAKKRHLKPDGVLIPEQAITKIAAVSLPDEFFEYAGFGPLAALYAEKIYANLDYQFLPRICIKNINHDYLISNSAVLENLSFNGDTNTENKENTTITINRNTQFSGFMAWLNLYDQEGNYLDILEDNHCWVPVYFPALNNKLRVKKGDIIRLGCEYRLCKNELNPDYFIRAEIWRENNLLHTFNYNSFHFHSIKQSNPFYNRLFKNKNITFSPIFTEGEYIQFIKQQLSYQLPPYMVPKSYIFVEKLPLNHHGKIDFPKLKELNEHKKTPGAIKEKPQNDLEIKLAAIWSKFISFTEIDRNDNFFHLGGDSIQAIQVVSEIQNEGLPVTVQELYTFPSIATLAQCMAANLAKNRQKERINEARKPTVDLIKSEVNLTNYRLSSIQKNMLSIHLAYPNSDLYLNQVYWYTRGINQDNYKKAWELLIADTEILRVSFVWKTGEEPQQLIHKQINLKWQVIDWSAFSKQKQQTKLKSYLVKDREEHFNLDSPSPMRVTFIKLNPDEHIILWTHHHIMLDGWSLPLLLNKLDLFYEYLEEKKSKPLPNPYQFSQYIEWLDKQDKDIALSFWKQKLQGVCYPTHFNVTKKSLVKYDINSTYLSLTDFLSENLTQHLKQFSQEHAITINTVLQMAWAILLANYSAQKNVVFGTTVSGRTVNVNNIDKIPGLLINTIPLHIQLDDNNHVLSSMHEFQRDIQQAQSYSYVGLHEIKKVVDWNQALPLFYSLTLFENYPSTLKNKLYFVEKTNFPLTISFSLSEKLCIDLTYAAEYFAAETIARMMQHLKQVLFEITHHSHKRISDLTIVPETELRLLEQWNNTATALPPLTIHQVFERQVNQHPNKVALCQGEKTLTYESLNKQSTQLAHHLHTSYVQEYQHDFPLETVIAIYLPRGIDLFVSILGILKAGGCYVPLDPSYPKQRNDFIVEDANPTFIITNSQLSKELTHYKSRLIYIPEESVDLKLPPIKHHPKQLAYIIYTSGSTGIPNGVLIEHQGVVNLALNTAKALKVSSKSRLLQLNSPCFDTSVQEWSLALLNGATLIVPTPDELPPYKEIGQLISEKAISHLDAPPYVLENIKLQNFPSLEVIISGGDVCHQALVDRWALNYHFINDYGPTEATICVSMTICKPGVKPTIGKPHPNTKLYVLNQYGALAPIGAVGELFVSGVGLARGYLNRPELMQQRFIANPFQSSNRPLSKLAEMSDVRGDAEQRTGIYTRVHGDSSTASTQQFASSVAFGKEANETAFNYLYKTGDLVQWTEQGELIYLGRNDGQLKVRGYRIEPNEIENSLLNHDNVKHSVVIADKNNQQKLTVFIEEDKQGLFNANDYRNYLQKKLPPFMVPNDYILVETIPLLPNSKVDKKALATLVKTPTSQHTMKPPNTEEAVLIEVYSQILGSHRISAESNFYAVGGDSINAIHLTALMHQRGYRFSPYLVDKYPTINELAKHIKKSDERAVSEILPNRPFNLSPVQQWFFERLLANPHHYNQAIMLGRTEPYDERLLKQTMAELLKRHDSLHLRFKQQKNGWKQYYATDKKSCSVPIKFYDLSGVNPSEKTEIIAQHCKTLHASLNIEKGPMHAIACFSGLDAPQNQLFWVCHHLICDNVSWYLLISDFKKIYTSLEQNNEALVPKIKKNVNFFIWLQQLQHYANKVFSQQVHYWLKVSEKIKMLPFDLQPSSFTQADMHHLDVFLTANQSKALLTTAHENLRTSPVELILASLLSAFNQWRGLNELSIEMEGHGREPIAENNEGNQITGWFTSLYPVHFDHADFTQLQNLILYIKNYLRKIPDKGIGYGALCYLLKNQHTKKLKQYIHPSLSFNYMGVLDNQAQGQFSFIETDTTQWVSAINQSDYPLAINCYFINQQFKLQLSYSSKHFHQASMHALQRKITQEFERILGFCTSIKSPVYTISDFPLINLAQDVLTQLTKDKDIEVIYPLTHLQQGLLFHATEKNDPYIAQLHWTIDTPINVINFKNAWSELIQRNAILRTSFHQLDCPVQMVHKTAPLNWHEHNWTNLSEDHVKNKLDNLFAQDKAHNFDLQKPGCMRFYFIYLDRGSHLFIWSHHHIILDGWSINLLLKQLDFLYRHMEQKRFQHATLPFGNYITWFMQQPRENVFYYWKNRLKNFNKPTQLLIHKTTRLVRKSSHVSLHLPDELLSKCELFCQQHTITLNTLIHSAWSLVMAKYSNDEDLLFGMTVSGRNIELNGVENIVGLLINTLPVRIQLKRDDLVIDLIQNLHQQIRDSQQHGLISLSEIKEAIGWKGNAGLFQYISVFENYPQHQEGLLSKSKINEETHYPLSFVFSHQKKLTLTAIYDVHCFAHTLIKSMLSHISYCLKNMINSAESPIKEIEILSTQEKTTLLKRFNSPFAVDLPPAMNIIAAFEQICLNYPNNTALSYEKHKISYVEFQQMINTFSTYILHQYQFHSKQEFKMETAIPLLMEKGINQILAIMSVIKLGGMYVPIDPALPQERIKTIIAETNCQLVISDNVNRNKLNNLPCILISVDDNRGTQSTPAVFFPKLHHNNLAYMIFTSGTTGKPKGIMIEHKSVINYVKWMTQELDLKKTDRFMQSSSYGFDASIWEIFVPLLTGAQLCIPGSKEQKDFSSLVKWMKLEKISIAQFVPSLLPLLMETADFEQASDLRYLCAGGEELAYNLVKLILERKNVEIVNLYGPTEVTIDATFKRINRNNIAKCNPIPIGRPLLNTQVLILDQYNQLTPVGVPGELCVSGIGLARGYFQNKELTEHSFINNPFAEKKQFHQKFLYKTGDLACWLPQGDIQYLGRKDKQVKIRGNRIELSEIKEHLLNLKRIKQVVLLFIEEEQKIIAFCKGYKKYKQPLNDYVKEKLSQSLPHYMIPVASIALEQFPLNSNDKIDYEVLKTIYRSSIESNKQEHYYAKNSIIADSLSSIWKRIFKLNVINHNSNFYELGGHSLKAMQLVLQIENYLQISCPITVIFNHPQFSDLVHYLSRQKLKQQNISEFLPGKINSQQLSAEQKRIWFLSQVNSKINQSYNMVLSFTLEGDLNRLLFEKSLNQVVQNNEILRAKYNIDNNQVVQEIAENIYFTLDFVSIKNELHLDQFIKQAVTQPFDLKHRCWNAFLLKISNKKHLFLLIMHHIIGDGLSLKLMMEELNHRYNHPTQNVPAKMYQYSHYVAWQMQFLATSEAKKQLQYWKNKLAHYEPIALPYKTSQLNQINYDSHQLEFIIDKTRLNQIKLICEKESCTPFMFIYTLLNVLLYKFTLQTDIILGLPISQRHLPNSETIMGCLLNTLVLRNQFSSDDSFTSLLHSSKALCLESYENQLIPFEQIIQAVEVKRDPLRNPLFQVLLNWHTQDESINLCLNEVTVKSYEIPLNLAKFDLVFTFTETANKLLVSLEYNKNLFTKHLMQQMKTGFQNVLTTVIDNGEIKLSTISLLTKKQQQKLMATNTIASEFHPPTYDLFDLFYKQVNRFPKKIAIKHGENLISYQELYQQSMRLSSCFPGKGEIIAVILERGINMITSMLAILASENAFLLIDPEITPTKRIQMFIKQSDIRTIISSAKHREILKKFNAKSYTIVELDDFNQNNVIESYDRKFPNNKIDKLAYIIFTSGTTHQSKAIKITHINLINHLFWRQSLFKLSNKDIFLQKTNSSFDASIWEFFLPLVLGARSIIVDSKNYKQPDCLLQTIKSEKITIAQFAPSMLELVLQSHYAHYLSQLHHLCLGGEILSRQLYKKCRAVYKNNLYNLYGPAEATIDVSYYHARTHQIKTHLPIGIPISNVSLYIVDEGLNLVPKGCIGELAISGYAVGDGYLNNPELTAEKFIKNPFYQSNEPHAYSKLYLSGDLVRMNQENNIEFICRKDRQIKFHGIRIDLREIEYYLELHQKIEGCRVLYYGHHDKQYLIAFLISSEDINLSTGFWKQYLEDYIPEYMQPSYYFSIDSIPYTANGKTDEQQLNDIIKTYFSEIPESSDHKDDLVMKQLKLIWAKVLGHHQFTTHDDFFLVGGDSILAVHLIHQINERFNSSLAITWAFTHSKLMNQAEILQLGYDLSYTPITQLKSVSNNQNLFIMHSGTGGAEVYSLLASAIQNFSIYGIEPYNFYHPDTMIDNISALAEYYVQLIQAQQKTGPYYLAGWSLGGLIAFEVAHRLQKMRGEIVSIYLFDSFMYDTAFATRIAQFYETNMNNQALLLDLLGQTGLPVHHQQKLINLIMNNCKMIQQYSPKYYAGKVILFKATQKEPFNKNYFPTSYVETIHQLHDLADNGWSPWVKQLEIQMIDCHHMNLLTGEHIFTIAQRIDETVTEFGLKELI